MKAFLVVIFCAFYSLFYSQEGKELQVNYIEYYDSESPFKRPCILYIEGNNTLYRTIYSRREYWDNGKSSPLFFRESTATDLSDDYLKLNHKAKELLKHEHLPSETVITTDYYPEQIWIITSDTRQISGYACIKATTNYRGRDWIVWFTPDIPVPYGPWKLHGLPGLIMEVISADGQYIIKAETILYQKNTLMKTDFKQLKKVHNAVPITYRQFLIDWDEASENINLKISQQYNVTITSETPTRNGYELKYEWEQ